MTDEELNAATEGLQFMLDGYRDKNSWEGYPRMLRDGITAITTLRAQLAEARAERDKWYEGCGVMHVSAMREAQRADKNVTRAERAEQRVATLEAALAAQIEADAGLLQAVADNWDCGHNESRLCDCVRDIEQWRFAADEIRNQPHDRTALDRMLAEAREKALREAADALRGQGYGNAVRIILALIEKEKTE